MTSGCIFSSVCHLYGDDGDFDYMYVRTGISVALGFVSQGPLCLGGSYWRETGMHAYCVGTYVNAWNC